MKKSEKNKIKLWLFSKRTKIPKHKVVEVIASSGIKIDEKGLNTTLSHKHVEIIASVFIQSVNDFQKQTASSYDSLPNDTISNLKNFFSNFISDSQELTDEEIFRSSIEIDKVRDFFYSIVYENEHSQNVPGINKILRKLRYKIKKSTPRKRVIRYTFYKCNSNYIYPKEDDEHYILANHNFCFSIVLNFTKRSFNKNINLIKEFLIWKKYNILLEV